MWLFRAAKLAGITILPPDIQHSHYPFVVEAPMTIRYGFGAIKGLGEGVARAITAERMRRALTKTYSIFVCAWA